MMLACVYKDDVTMNSVPSLLLSRVDVSDCLRQLLSKPRSPLCSLTTSGVTLRLNTGPTARENTNRYAHHDAPKTRNHQVEAKLYHLSPYTLLHILILSSRLVSVSTLTLENSRGNRQILDSIIGKNGITDRVQWKRKLEPCSTDCDLCKKTSIWTFPRA